MRTIALFFISIVIIGCGSKGGTISNAEQHLCDSLQIDPSVILDLRQHTDAEVEAFHYSLSRQINPDGSEIELDPIHLKGLVFQETAENTQELLDKLQSPLKKKGYTLFTLDQNFGIAGKLDIMAILNTTDKYEVLNQIKTDGINYEITTDSLVKIIKTFDEKYNLELTAASGDWCEFRIMKEPTDWLTIANEAYAVCPDIVDQGAGSVETLAEEMKRTRRLYFWWD